MKKPLMVTIVTSISPESPCEAGGWKLYSFARNKFVTDVDADLYVAGYDRATGEVVPAGEELAGKLDTGLAYWLSYYEHGVGAWSLNELIGAADRETLQLLVPLLARLGAGVR